jgi:hypothetical protein
VASRSNGCVYCASVHWAFATHFSKRGDDVQRLLDEGVATDLGDDVWNAVRDAVVALTATPVRFGLEHVAPLHAAGLDDAAVLDVINSGSFFNWANRLMLSLGEPSTDGPTRLSSAGEARRSLPELGNHFELGPLVVSGSHWYCYGYCLDGFAHSGPVPHARPR